MKYGDKIIVKNGIFEGQEGIFFSKTTDNGKHFFKKLGIDKELEDPILIEVFFKTKAIEPDNAEDYFNDYLFNPEIPEKTTSAMIIISEKDIELIR